LLTVNDITIPSVNVIFILIAVSLLVAIGFLVSFIWSIKAGQFDDEYTPSVRILFDDETNVIEDGLNSKSQAPNSKQNTKHKKPIPKNQEPRTKN
jgi:cbb3-type cytochrome oxidase maturation protein